MTLEANPSTAEAGRFRGFRAAGVGRLSLGVQSLDDAALRFLGRGHSAAEARAAVALAAAIFPRFSFDMIWGRPGHTLAAWRRELAEAVAMAGDHLSVYQLTIEPGTAFWRDGVPALDEAAAADLYEATQTILDGSRPAALRDLQPRPAGRSMPAQPRRLARRRLPRHRPRRPWPAQPRRPHRSHPRRQGTGEVARPRRDQPAPASPSGCG